MTKKRAIVTGGAGFLGSHLCQRLLAEGFQVTAFDCLHTGRLENFNDYKNNPDFQFVKGDVTESVTLPKAHWIFNLACPASPPHYQENPVWTWKTSVLGAMHMAELAKAWGARILQASTSECYGDPLVHPQPETYWGHVNPVGIRSCYDEGKRAAETLLMDMHRGLGLDMRIVRIFNTYGPRMRADDGRVVSNFVVQALKGESLSLYGDGSQTRSFCYVSDLVEVIFRMMSQETGFVGPVNIGNPVEFTVLELAQLVLEMTGSSAKLSYHPLPGDDPKVRRPDITLARTQLGWEPKVPLKEGLKATIAYFKAGLQA
ncbi:MAG: NAD-dependent dehydratase [Candidatus Lambdaproteobacteria bacterium RIFOXYD2_FULL_50_16]|uniref:UDP-glucuronate decarboxylase n=1 Tax=Candidatus Lambdaproteobacteria bacterium RIFOXYD2_FULL_50_16 TaxID=1817772 RepID=A0A1F6GD99_9PROT|nr:MAG: NAD-dependent dehydratase [Candidatus Lambdaproteobacteria bacterium RIFOXYD2_FULL_50_16]